MTAPLSPAPLWTIFRPIPGLSGVFYEYARFANVMRMRTWFQGQPAPRWIEYETPESAIWRNFSYLMGHKPEFRAKEGHGKAVL